MTRGWRQFRPRVQFRRHETAQNIVPELRRRLDEIIAIPSRGNHETALRAAVNEQASRVLTAPDAVEWFTLLVLRAPSAARAQQQTDEHPRGYHDTQARLYELIDFNDAYVSTVLALTDEQRKNFEAVARQEIERFCKRIGSRAFSDKQYEAITKGLGREVAVYLGALDQGFKVTMTSRTQDALGVDMVVSDPLSHKQLNIDCKSPSAYHYRLQDLVQQGRLTKREQLDADQIGYVREVNGHDDEAVTVTLLRIDPNEVGDIRDFRFTDSSLLGSRLKKMFKEL